MLAILIGLHAIFFYSAVRRWNLMSVGGPAWRFDRIPDRIRSVVEYALGQRKMHYYRLAGLAHHLIFAGFIVLLLNTIILWGRGLWAPFNFIFVGPLEILGHVYDLMREIVALLVIAGASTFVWLRVTRKARRMTLSTEGLVILGIIITMMVSDLLYNGALYALHAQWGATGCTSTVGNYTGLCGSVSQLIAPLGPPSPVATGVPFRAYAPVGSVLGMIMAALPTALVAFVAQAGFWTHSTLVLVFLNILPYSKHFHIITAIPNVFFRSLEPAGKLPTMAENSEKLMELVGTASEKADPLLDPIGSGRIEHFSWKAILDFYTCTECGRCSDNCPAHRTGKLLSPKQFTLNLRNHLYERDEELTNHYLREPAVTSSVTVQHRADRLGEAAERAASGSETEAVDPTHEQAAMYAPIDLVGNVIHPDVLWACTTCRACEEQCPVMISYVDKIVSMRRNLVTIKGEFPGELQRPFSGMETNGNPWNLARVDRAAWSDGLDVKTMAEHPTAEVLYWVGCAASYDDRAKKIARATARLLQQAGVDFAILAEEESCTGDPARRAGNEYLFLTLAEGNVATLNGYKDQGGVKKIITACPHCFNTLLNEYPEFGAKFEVVHHTDYLLGLLTEGKLKAKKAVTGKVVFHDSCYLGRYNGVYESPRDILKRIPGVELVEAEGWNRNKGLCCGAGGAQMWMEEQNKDRVNVKRTLQLLDTKATTVASACPFCMTMLTDGLKKQEVEAQIKQLDVAEMLAESCLDGPGAAAVKAEAAEAQAAS
ncbi:MAG: (Fe-S)-binding protein [Myxococcales bacterium]|nr:MAG: (Fe-S)-binding protein [Myxococcales bacterium]